MRRLRSMQRDRDHQGLRQYWFAIISVALQTSFANVTLPWQNQLFQKNRRRESGGYIHDDIDGMLDYAYVTVRDAESSFVQDD